MQPFFSGINLVILGTIFWGTIVIMLVTTLIYTFIKTNESKKRIAEMAETGFIDQPRFVRELTEKEGLFLQYSHQQQNQFLVFLCILFSVLEFFFVYLLYLPPNSEQELLTMGGLCFFIGIFLVPLVIYIINIMWKVYLDLRTPVYRVKGSAYIEQQRVENSLSKSNYAIYNLYIDDLHLVMFYFRDYEKNIIFEDQIKNIGTRALLEVEYTAFTKTIVAITQK